MQRFYSQLSAIFALLSLVSALVAIILALLGSPKLLIVALATSPMCMLGAIYLKVCEVATNYGRGPGKPPLN